MVDRKRKRPRKKGQTGGGNDISEKGRGRGSERKRARKLDERISTNNTERRGFTGVPAFLPAREGERGEGKRWGSTRWRDLIGRGGKYDSA